MKTIFNHTKYLLSTHLSYFNNILRTLFLFLFLNHSTFALVAGDVIIIGLTGDIPGQFTWVPLVDLSTGEVIRFTNAGWDDTTNDWPFNSDSGSISITAPAGGITAGTPQTVIMGIPGPAPYVDSKEPLDVSELLDGIQSLFTTGSSMIVWQGPENNPTFIFHASARTSKETL